MDIQAEKLHLFEELAKLQDIQIIKQIIQLLKQGNDPVVGYGIDGRSITRRELIKRIEKAEERIDNGKIHYSRRFRKESENW